MKNLKRFAAFVMCAALCLSLTAAAFAEEEVQEINWTEEMEQAVAQAGIEGEFAVIDKAALQMFIPAAMRDAELSEEEKAEGLIACYVTEDDSAIVTVRYLDGEGVTLEDYSSALEEMEDVSDLDVVIVNGIPYLDYVLKKDDCGCLATVTESGYILEFVFYPMSDEGFASVAGIMLSSIQPVDAEEEAPAA